MAARKAASLATMVSRALALVDRHGPPRLDPIQAGRRNEAPGWPVTEDHSGTAFMGHHQPDGPIDEIVHIVVVRDDDRPTDVPGCKSIDVWHRRGHRRLNA